MGRGFAGEGRLVDVQAHCLKQFAVGWNLSAGVKHHDVAHHDILFRDFSDDAVAPYLHGLVVTDLVEQVELLVGLALEDEPEAGGQENGGENAYRFKEYLELAVKIILIDRNADRGHSGHKQDYDQRFTEFVEKQSPCRTAFLRGEHIGAMFGATLLHLAVGQPLELLL